MTAERDLQQLLDQRDGVPPADDQPTDTGPGEMPAGPDEIDEED